MQASNAKSSENFESHELANSSYQVGTNSGTTLEPDRKQSSTGEVHIVSAHGARINTEGEGYSDFFQSTSIPAPDFFQSGTAMEPDNQKLSSGTVVSLSLKEAVEFYKISEKTIRLQIKEGKIPAKKVQGTKVLEWRIYPNGLPQDEESNSISNLEPDQSADASVISEYANLEVSPEPNWYQSGSKPENSQQSAFAIELRTLMDVITKQAEKLEAANYRNGYLEAQLSGAQEQLKLLPDLSAKATRTENLEDKIANLESELEAAKRSWWARFGAWFMGK